MTELDYEHLSIRIKKPLKRRLRMKAFEMDLSMSRFVIRAIETYLQRLEQRAAEDAAKAEEFMRGYENDWPKRRYEGGG